MTVSQHLFIIYFHRSDIRLFPFFMSFFMTPNGYFFNLITLNQAQISYDYLLNIPRTGISC